MIKNKQRKIRIACLAAHGAHAGPLYGAIEMFQTASRCKDQDRPEIQAMIVSEDGAPVTSVSGHRIDVDCDLATAGSVDAVFIPAIATPSSPPLVSAACVSWLQEQFARRAMIAAACTGVRYLAGSGLLDGQKYTTNRDAFGEMRHAFPQSHLETSRSLVVAGPGQRLITSGGGALWIDLSLYLVFRLLGMQTAIHLARLNNVDWSLESAFPDMAFEALNHHSDYKIRQAQKVVIKNYHLPDILTLARQRSGLPNRTFERRFKSALGMSCVKYVQSVRIERAKQFLTCTTEIVDSVAEMVGYADPASFRRLFSKTVGMSPGEYRIRNRA